MANKERQKRSARKARAEERARREAMQAASAPAGASQAKEQKKAESSKAVAKAEKNKKPGFFKRIGNWFGDVKAEMRRVTWPSKEELRSYSVAVIVMLVVFGVLVWLVDTGIVAALVGFTGLRG